MTDAPATNELLALADELDAFHDCADGQPSNGNGHFRLVCESESDQQRLNLRAVLREAAKALRAAATPSAQGVEVSVEDLAGSIREVVISEWLDGYWSMARAQIQDGEANMTILRSKVLNKSPVIRYDLKDCPFCGSSPEIQYWHGGRPTKRLISCSNPDCEINPGVTGETERDAIAKWERRAP